MLDINPAIVCDIILKMKQFQAKEAPSYLDDGSNPTDDRSWQVLAENKEDSVEEE